MMIQKYVRSENRRYPHRAIGHALTCLTLLIWSSAWLSAENVNAMHVTHILGCTGIPAGANGSISIHEKALQFQSGQGATAEIKIDAIQDVFLGEQDKQIGGTAMAVGRAAAPFGGGRVVGLFSHKKYDTLTLEYRDTDGGLHGAIFQLNKGQGQVLRNELASEGAHVARLDDQANKTGTLEIKHENK